MLRLIRISAVGLASLFAAAGGAHAQAWHGERLAFGDHTALVGESAPQSQLVLVQDRPPLDGVISSLESRYGPGEVKSVSDTFVGRDGRYYFTVKYLTEDGQMIIVKVDADSGQIVGGG